MAATVTLDWHELLWWLQGGMSGSHLRWSVYEDFVDRVWPQLDDKERENIYTYAKRDLSWHFEGDHVDETPHQYFLQLLARFNPANQYVVTLKASRGKRMKKEAYLWNGKYYVDWKRFCATVYIVKVEQKKYQRCGNGMCKYKDRCMRYVEYTGGDLFMFGDLRSTSKCDFFIEKTDDEQEERAADKEQV